MQPPARGTSATHGTRLRSPQAVCHPRSAMDTVVFHRHFERFQGGHLKVFHYFEHVRSSPSHRALIRFTSDSYWGPENPWWSFPDAVLAPDDPTVGDIRFLAGMDWRAIPAQQRSDPPVPVINLIQGFRHTRPQSPAFEFLHDRAVRLCVSPELEQALRDIDIVQGPVFTVPIGLDLERLPAPRPLEQRELDCLVLAVKAPRLGAEVAKGLRREGRSVVLVDRLVPREQLINGIAGARVSVHVPALVEGAYLPALESMALDTLVVCPDCVGNRSFCRDGETCLAPARTEEGLLEAALELLRAGSGETGTLLEGGRREIRRHALGEERRAFLAILDRVPELWLA